MKQPRLKVLMYSGEGAGKTHFCCSFPETYYIDTEGLEDYPHFVKMVEDGKGTLIYLTELSEIIQKVTWLLSQKNTYKTLVIDSISFPYGWLSQIEADRLGKKSGTEGTEFGANLAKAKRLTFQLGILLSRLDMNVIVTAHEKTKYEKNIEIEKTYDITDKMAYSLGAVWNLKLLGKDRRKLYIKKSRYPEMLAGDSFDFDNGYEVLKKIFGESIFKREANVESLATKDQVIEFNRLISLLNISEENVNKLLTKAKAVTIEEVSKDYLERIIDKLQHRISGDEAA